MTVLQYSDWQNFEKIINKAKISCQNSDISILDHFIDVSKMVQIGSGSYREQIDYKLTINVEGLINKYEKSCN